MPGLTKAALIPDPDPMAGSELALLISAALLDGGSWSPAQVPARAGAW